MCFSFLKYVYTILGYFILFYSRFAYVNQDLKTTEQ